MNENWTDELITAYIDGILSADERQRVEEYLRKHPEQNQKVRHLQKIKSQLSELPSYKLDNEFTDRILARVGGHQSDSKPVPGRKIFRHRKSAVAIAALAAMIVLSLFIGPYLAQKQDAVAVGEAATNEGKYGEDGEALNAEELKEEIAQTEDMYSKSAGREWETGSLDDTELGDQADAAADPSTDSKNLPQIADSIDQPAPAQMGQVDSKPGDQKKQLARRRSESGQNNLPTAEPQKRGPPIQPGQQPAEYSRSFDQPRPSGTAGVDPADESADQALSALMDLRNEIAGDEIAGDDGKKPLPSKSSGGQAAGIRQLTRSATPSERAKSDASELSRMQKRGLVDQAGGKSGESTESEEELGQRASEVESKIAGLENAGPGLRPANGDNRSMYFDSLVTVSMSSNQMKPAELQKLFADNSIRLVRKGTSNDAQKADLAGEKLAGQGATTNFHPSVAGQPVALIVEATPVQMRDFLQQAGSDSYAYSIKANNAAVNSELLSGVDASGALENRQLDESNEPADQPQAQSRHDDEIASATGAEKGIAVELRSNRIPLDQDAIAKSPARKDRSHRFADALKDNLARDTEILDAQAAAGKQKKEWYEADKAKEDELPTTLEGIKARKIGKDGQLAETQKSKQSPQQQLESPALGVERKANKKQDMKSQSRAEIPRPGIDPDGPPNSGQRQLSESAPPPAERPMRFILLIYPRK